jgi:hypothetical protein
MHPFLPVLSVLLLIMGNAAMLFARFQADHPEIAPHVSSLYAVVFISILCGAALAIWLRRFGLLFPSWIAILSLLVLGTATIF